MPTTEIKGLFSKEHSVLVLLICLCLYGTYQNYTKQNALLIQFAEMKADIKILTHQINGKQEKPMVAKDLLRREGKSKLQTASLGSIIGRRSRWGFILY